MRFKKYRAELKTLTYRALGTIFAILTFYFFTGDILLASEAGIVVNILKTFLYYIHEKIWERIDC